MKIVIDDNIPQLEERIRRAHPEIELVPLHRNRISAEAVRDADALIVRTHTKCNSTLLKDSRVKLVGTATIGKNHIDTAWCEANGIKVVNAPGCNAPAVMQYVVCGLHAAGFDPSSDTLGVIGKGHIGSLVVDIYRKAGAKVIVCDPPRAEAGYTDEDYLLLDDLLAACDAVTFHVPLTFPAKEEKHPTLHLLNADRKSFPRIIVNASRGAVVDYRLFTSSVPESSTLVIDTWPFEDDPEAKSIDPGRLVMIPLVATPHIAGYSLQGKQRATRKMIEALNDTFGLKIDADGLADYGFENLTPGLADVIASYDPSLDTDIFKSNPRKLESLRNDYQLRDEDKF